MREKKTVLKFFAKEKTRKCVQPHAHETHVPLKPTRDASSRNKWRSGVLCVGIPVPARLELELRPGPVFRPLQNHAPKKVIHTSEASFTSPLDSSRVGTRDCRPSLSLFPKDSWRLSRDRLACTVTIATAVSCPSPVRHCRRRCHCRGLLSQHRAGIGSDGGCSGRRRNADKQWEIVRSVGRSLLGLLPGVSEHGGREGLRRRRDRCRCEQGTADSQLLSAR